MNHIKDTGDKERNKKEMKLRQIKTSKERKAKILERIESYAMKCQDDSIAASNLQMGPKLYERCLDKECHKPLDLSTHAEGQLLARLKIPASYLHRCPRPLQQANVNYWLQNSKSEYLLRLICNEDWATNHVRAVFSTRYTPIDDINLIPVVFDALQKEASEERLEDVHIKDFVKNDEFTILRVVYKSLVAEKGEGEKKRYYWGGVTVTNSEVGKCAIWVKPIVRSATSLTGGFDFIDRSHEGSTRFIHVGDVDLDKIAEAVKLAKRASESGIAHLMKMEHEMVEQPAQKARKFIEDSDFIANRFADIIEEQYQEVERASKLALAESILAAVRELPTFQYYLAEGEVGRYLNLFADIEDRIKAVVTEHI